MIITTMSEIDWQRVQFYRARAGTAEHIVVGYTDYTLCDKWRRSMRQLVPWALCSRYVKTMDIPYGESGQKALAAEKIRCDDCVAAFAALRLEGDLPHDDY